MRKLEVEHYPAQKHKLLYKHYPYAGPDSADCSNALVAEQQLLKQLQRQHCICKVTMMVGQCDSSESNHKPKLLREVSSLLMSTNNVSYLVRGLTLDQLVCHTFTSCFTKPGIVSGISEGSLLDVDDSAVLYPNGRLSLLLTASSYHSLGLQGHAATNVLRKPRHKYVVHVNSSVSSFYPGRPCYNRAIECLAKIKMDVLLTWQHHDATTVCPSSIARYFTDLGYDVQLKEPADKGSFTVESVEVPDVEAMLINQQLQYLQQEKEQRITTKNKRSKDEESLLHCADLLETLGCFLLNIKQEDGTGRVDVMECGGLFQSTTLQHTLQHTRDWIHSPAGSGVSWCCLSFYTHPELPFDVVSDGCSSTTTTPDGSTKSGCKLVECGCGLIERDHHSVGCGMLLLLVTRSGVASYRYTADSTPHRYYAKTSNNK